MDTAVLAVGVAVGGVGVNVAGWVGVGVGVGVGVVVVWAPMAQAPRRAPSSSIKGALQRRDLRNIGFPFLQADTTEQFLSYFC